MKETNFKELSDKQVMQLYLKCVARDAFDFIQAGLAAGELHRRGYDIVEGDDDTPDKFVKQEKKVA